MPPRIYKSSYPDISVPQTDLVSFLFTNDAKILPSHPIYIDGITGETRTYHDVKQRTASLASALRSLGVRKNDIVALFSPNTIDYAIICYAVIGCGATVSPVNAACTHLELQHQLTTANARFLIAHSSLLETAAKDAEKCPSIESVIQADGSSPSSSHPLLHTQTAPYLATCTTPALLNPIPASQASTHLALLAFSSGTTSAPKGVMTTHLNLVSNILQWQHHIPEQCTPGQKWLAFLPFSHIYGLHYFVCQPIKFGCTAVVMQRFEMGTFLGLVERYRVETLSLVPPVVLGMGNVWDSLISKGRQYDLSSVKRIVSAAAPLSAELAGSIEGKFKEQYGTEVHVLQAWGLTETSPVCASVPAGEGGKWLSKRGWSVGNLTPNLELRVVDPDSGEDVEWNKQENESMSGELWIRGPNVCAGYFKNEDATKSGFAIDEEGRRWFRTGDIGTIDADGFVKIVDRMKEMIKYKGFQVIPSELEGKLLEHPDVADACVFGVYVGSLATEMPVGFVVLRPDAVSKRSREEVAAEVKAWLEGRIAGHKNLRGGLIAIDVIPKSPSGKILRRQLKGEWEKKVKEAVEGTGSKL